jgi:hypothetical protein
MGEEVKSNIFASPEVNVIKLTQIVNHLKSIVASLKFKELGGVFHTARGMLLNAILHAKPYPSLREWESRSES